MKIAQALLIIATINRKYAATIASPFARLDKALDDGIVSSLEYLQLCNLYAETEMIA